MRTLVSLLLAAFFASISCCGGGSSGQADLQSGADNIQEDALSDAAPRDARQDEMDAAAPDQTTDAADVPPAPPRLYTFRAVGGISMGANALTVVSQHPGVFDMTAALGGYINPQYVQHMMKTSLFGGLCDRETLLAHLDEINEPDSEALACTPVSSPGPWEYNVDINHWHADASGGDFDRGFYYWALEGIFMAWGNLLSYNPEHPWLPPGVPIEWAADDTPNAEKCANPIVLGKPFNYNAEYNPDGEYDVITICDGDGPWPVDEDHPDYWMYKGMFYADHTYTDPVHIVLAVDYNGNGRRDYHEPMLVNNMERFTDSGADRGGDDVFHIPNNALGTAGDGWRQEGEPFEDFGLDGVDGTGDYGEGDGEWTVNPNILDVLARTPMIWLDTAPIEELNAVDILMDGGIRDSLAAAAGTYPLFAHLKARGVDAQYYGNYSGSPDAILPTNSGMDYPTALHMLHLTAADIGQHVMVAYGSEDATPEEIAAGDGKHVGNGNQIVNRFAAYVLMALQRWPAPETEPCDDPSFGTGVNDTFYSPSMQTRYRVSYSLPPCYDKEGWEDKRYPLLIFLSGHGMTAETTIAASMIFNVLAKDGTLPKFIMAVPAGECCKYDREAKERYCACEKEGANYLCVDPHCTGPHEECDILEIPKEKLEEECNGGNFFTNHVSNRWGDVEAAKNMKYGDMLIDLVAHLEGEVRLKEAAEY